MKYFFSGLIAILFAAFIFPSQASAQDNLDFELSYEVNCVYPMISISKEKSMVADSISQLNKYYKPSWVKEYISVEIMAKKDGRTTKATGKNDLLTKEQKSLISMADAGADITVLVKYIPDNTLSQNDPREEKFTFKIDPKSAEYPGGQASLKQFLKINAIDKIPVGCFQANNLTAVKFTIDTKGKVKNIHVSESSNDDNIDQLLMETIGKMKNWKPAEYADGSKVDQEFVFTVGDMRSCVVNLLNIRKE